MELFPQWFDQHPESDICYFGTLLCGICNLVGFFSLSSNQEETMKQLSYTSDSNIHSHKQVKSFQCMVGISFFFLLISSYVVCLQEILWNEFNVVYHIINHVNMYVQ